MNEEKWHGTVGGYSNHKCKCSECKLAWRANTARMRRDRQQNPIPPNVAHGSASTYENWYCRCVDCKAAKSAKAKNA